MPDVNMTEFSAKHVLVLAPAQGGDQESTWVHLIAKHLDGLDTDMVLTPSNALSYLDKSGEIFNVTKINLGYLIEIPTHNRTTFNVFDWIKEEMDLESIYPDDYYLEDVRPEHIDVAGIGKNVEGEDVVWVVSTQRINAPYLWTEDGVTRPFARIDLMGVEGTVRALAVEGTAEDFIVGNFGNHISETELIIFGLPLKVWVRPEWKDAIQWN